jgi:hypothetical protein
MEGVGSDGGASRAGLGRLAGAGTCSRREGGCTAMDKAGTEREFGLGRGLAVFGRTGGTRTEARPAMGIAGLGGRGAGRTGHGSSSSLAATVPFRIDGRGWGA